MSQLSVTAELTRFGPEARIARPQSRAEAAEYCRRLTRTHYENFTVASWLLPRVLRPHFHAIYAYCRWADDLADEAPQDDRIALLDWWEVQLNRCYAGEADHPVFVALLETIREFEIPQDLFSRLLTAFRQDQQVSRYPTHDDVLAYCRNSANPVGRLVLCLARCHDEQPGELADAICTGLQLANFCQDVARDWDRGRVYLPQATLARSGYDDAMFARCEHNEAFREVMRHEVDRAEHYLRAGEPLVDLVPRNLRVDVALFAAGGMLVLQAIRGLDYNVWCNRPTISKASQLRLLAGCWWRSLHPARRDPRK